MNDPAQVAEAVRTALPERLLKLLAERVPRCYLVGGCVRDAVLGRPLHDVDLAVEGDVLATARVLSGLLGTALVPLDTQRATYRLVLRAPLDGIRVLDLVGLRGPSIEADLALRDFTINAVAVATLPSAPALDPTGGLEDLKGGLLRVASPRSFLDDPLRLLRLVRFVVELGFRPVPDTLALAESQAHLLEGVAGERSRDEFARILAAPESADGMRMLDKLGLLSRLLPELDRCRGVEQPPEHAFDVFEHCMQAQATAGLLVRPAAVSDAEREWLRTRARAPLAAVGAPLEGLHELLAEQRPRSALLVLAALLHDVAKPETKTVDPESGRMRFFGHDHAGAERARAAMRRLRFATREIDYVALLVDEHLRPGMLASPGEAPTARALFRLFRDLGDWTLDLFLLHFADHAAVRGPRLTRQEWERHVDYAAWVLRILYEDDQIARPPKLVDGRELMSALSLPPGPAIGRLLGIVREAQAAGEVTTQEQAIALARAELVRAADTAEQG